MAAKLCLAPRLAVMPGELEPVGYFADDGNRRIFKITGYRNRRVYRPCRAYAMRGLDYCWHHGGRLAQLLGGQRAG